MSLRMNQILDQQDFTAEENDRVDVNLGRLGASLDWMQLVEVEAAIEALPQEQQRHLALLLRDNDWCGEMEAEVLRIAGVHIE